MRPKSLILIVFALGCGLVASIGISQVLESKNQQSTSPQMEMQNIFVAIEDIDINEQLTPELIKLEPWPKDKVPEGAVTSLEEIEKRRPRVRLYAGEPILERKLFGSNEDKGASKMIPNGFRVHAVRVTAETSASGLILPGDRVDVLVYLRSSGAITKTLTRTILKNVRVFAVNEQTHRETDSEGNTITAKTVSLLVKPSQVEVLMLASQLGSLSLSLRPPNDDTLEDDTDDATIEELMGIDEDADPKKKKKPIAEAKPDNGGFLGFLQNYGGSSKPVEMPAETGPQWTMDLLDPSGVRRFEFGQEGMLPLEVAPGAANSSASAPVSIPMQGLGSMPLGPGFAPNGAGLSPGQSTADAAQGDDALQQDDDASLDQATPLGLDD